MSALLHSPRGRVGLGIAGGLLLAVAIWLLLVSPQREKATELAAQVDTSRAELAERRAALINPSANVTVKAGDIYRLTKALPNETNMAGILLDVSRLSRRNSLEFHSITPSPKLLATGFAQQPLAVVVNGRFADVSRFLGDLRSLVSVRRGRLDARGRLYSVSQVEMGAPESGKKFPTVQARVMLNAYTFSAPIPDSTTPPPTSTGTSPGGTVAAGATP